MNSDAVVLVLQMFGVLTVFFTVGYLVGHGLGALMNWHDRRRK